jgi:hypothetical protein
MLSKICCSAALCALLLQPTGTWAHHVNALKSVPVSSISGPILPNIPVILPPAVVEVSLTAMASAPAAPVTPSVLEPLKRLSCVPYARLRSGLQIFGDAKTWWAKAKSLYAQVAAPVSQAVMVFSGSNRIARGHVAVVTQVISPREIKVDHANWQNRGEIYLNMPVLDVSQNNDWSEVRVWNMHTNSFGTHVYKISGFITNDQVAR